MAFRKKLSNRLNRLKKTQLYLLETGKWAAGNSRALMELLSTGVRTTAGSLSARNAAVDITHGIEDYLCSDYKCLVLDSMATICDITGAVTCFIPGGNMTKRIFGVSTSASCFCRTLPNKCKKTNVLGCT
jgi:hypothetical protein